MKRGTAAGESAREWLASLPVFDLEAPVDGIYIARAEVDELLYRLVRLRDSVVSNVRKNVDGTYYYWCFDVDSDSFVLRTSAGNDATIAEDVIETFGLEGYTVGSLVQYDNITKGDVTGQLKA